LYSDFIQTRPTKAKSFTTLVKLVFFCQKLEFKRFGGPQLKNAHKTPLAPGMPVFAPAKGDFIFPALLNNIIEKLVVSL
jgi:hypothetical protein